MKRYTAAELKAILDKHSQWLAGTGKGERADLRFVDLRNADLSNVDLRFVDLRFSDLRNADLRNADLRFSDLRNADLRFSDLRFSDLRFSDLRNADLRFSDLRNANLSNATGNMREIKSLHCDTWNVIYTSTHMHIGCESHEIPTWWAFEDADISRMDRRALSWWAVWKPILKNLIEVSPATHPLTTETKGEQA